jgi:hypothetical protein
LVSLLSDSQIDAGTRIAWKPKASRLDVHRWSWLPNLLKLIAFQTFVAFFPNRDVFGKNFRTTSRNIVEPLVENYRPTKSRVRA